MSRPQQLSSPKTKGLLDVFQPGLRRGAERLPFDPEKRYFYVEHPTEGWRVYLRAVCFIHEADNPQPKRFLVVKKTGAKASSANWEPPKGQMEGKEDNGQSILELLKRNVQREVFEEAKLTALEGLRHTGLVLQSTEPDYPANTYFQYHIFQATATAPVLEAAFYTFDWFAEHPRAFARVKRDKREKDALAWYDPRTTRIGGRWGASLISMYLQKAGVQIFSI